MDEADAILSWGLLYLERYKYEKYSSRLNIKMRLNQLVFSEHLSILVSFFFNARTIFCNKLVFMLQLVFSLWFMQQFFLPFFSYHSHSIVPGYGLLCWRRPAYIAQQVWGQTTWRYGSVLFGWNGDSYWFGSSVALRSQVSNLSSRFLLELWGVTWWSENNSC